MSAIMLDTCGLIWLVNGGGRISEKTLRSIEKADVVYVSAATALEVGCKAAGLRVRSCNHATMFPAFFAVYYAYPLLR